MLLTVKRKLEIPKTPYLNCQTWRKSIGYLGYVECDTFKAYRLRSVWESKVPPVEAYCGGGDPDKDPRCAVPLPGFGHPHVVMMNDTFYQLTIDMP